MAEHHPNETDFQDGNILQHEKTDTESQTTGNEQDLAEKGQLESEEEKSDSNLSNLSNLSSQAPQQQQQQPPAPPKDEGKPLCFLPWTLLIKPKPSPKEYTRHVKWIITIIVAICAGAAPLGSTILMPALVYIADDFNTSQTKTNLSIAFYSLAVAFVPLWWSSLSETYGRRPVYLLSFLLLIVFNVLSAESTSIDMFIVMRTLSGGASASVQSVGAGTIADLWEVKERGRAMGIFFLGPICGPLIAPIIGGAITDPLGWRSTQWALVIYAGVLWISMIFFLPETSGKKKPPKKVQEGPKPPLMKRIGSSCAKIWTAFWAPVKVVPLFRFLPISLTVYYASITFASYYFLNISIQATFSASPYNFTAIEVGLMYIPSAIGAGLAGIFGGKWMDKIMHRKAEKAERYDENGKLQFRPTDRVGENAWIAGIIYPLALLWYGWVARYGVFWFASCPATFFFGAGQMLVFNFATTMLTEFVPKRTSTAVALNNLLRNTLACIAAIVTQPLLDAIGNGWLFTMVCFICLPSILVLALMQWKADAWGASMRAKLEG